MTSHRFSIWDRVGLDIAWVATERVCWVFVSCTHDGKLTRDCRRAVRTDGRRIEDEPGAARGKLRSIVQVGRVVGETEQRAKAL